MTPEAKTKAAVKKILVDAGAWYFCPYSGGMGRAGIPDFIACVKGYFLAIECKAGKGKATTLQQREIDAIRGAGGTAHVIYDDETDYRLLATLLQTLQLKDTS
jgi:Holliday junction resolvase